MDSSPTLYTLQCQFHKLRHVYFRISESNARCALVFLKSPYFITTYKTSHEMICCLESISIFMCKLRCFTSSARHRIISSPERERRKNRIHNCSSRRVAPRDESLKTAEIREGREMCGVCGGQDREQANRAKWVHFLRGWVANGTNDGKMKKEEKEEKEEEEENSRDAQMSNRL